MRPAQVVAPPEVIPRSAASWGPVRGRATTAAPSRSRPHSVYGWSVCFIFPFLRSDVGKVPSRSFMCSQKLVGLAEGNVDLIFPPAVVVHQLEKLDVLVPAGPTDQMIADGRVVIQHQLDRKQVGDSPSRYRLGCKQQSPANRRLGEALRPMPP